MLGLRRLKLNAIWLEIFPGTGNEIADRRAIRSFKTQLRRHGLVENYCLLYQPRASDAQELDGMRCLGISESDLRSLLAGPNVLLNLSYSIHPPLLLQFERRIFCDLDPSEIFYWMTKMEMVSPITTNFGRSDSTLTGTIVSCRNHHFAGKHSIRWWTLNFSLHNSSHARRSLRRLGSGIGAGPSKWPANFPTCPKNVRLNLT